MDPLASPRRTRHDANGQWLSERISGRPVHLYYDHPMISGGQLRGKVSPLTASVAMPDGKKHTFVKVGTTERWLVSMITGNTNYRHGLFGVCPLFDSLHALVGKGAEGQGRTIKGRMPRPSIGPRDDDAPEDPDPMDEIQCIDCRGGGGRGVKRHRLHDPSGVRPQRNPHKGDVIEFEMPKRCPEEDPGCTDMERIWIYMQDKRSIWIHSDNLQWAVSYLRCQYWLKGVPMVADSDPGPGAGSDPAPPTPLDSDLDLGSSPGPPSDSQCLGPHTPGRGGGGNSDADSGSECLGPHTFARGGGDNVSHAD